MNLPLRGTKCQLGALHGPMNHECLNGTHPAMLAGQRCNSDVQIPYRFPIVSSTHTCEDNKCLAYSEKAMIEMIQMAQDAQAGYACDYCTKRQPMAFNEVKECCKGHQKLGEKYQGEPINKLGKRFANRIMSDAYGKGIVRAQVENTNLRVYSQNVDVTSAECMHTCQTENFWGKAYVDKVQLLSDQYIAKNHQCFLKWMHDVRTNAN